MRSGSPGAKPEGRPAKGLSAIASTVDRVKGDVEDQSEVRVKEPVGIEGRDVDGRALQEGIIEKQAEQEIVHDRADCQHNQAGSDGMILDQ